MAIERTLSIIKPDATKRNLTGKINNKFEEAGLRIIAQKRIHLSKAQAGVFYEVHAERPFYDELCEFMGMEKGTELARTEVTKHLHEYIKKNSLQVETNKTLIVPDSNLKNLLALEDDVSKEIHFFSLQKYMNKHFV